MSDRDVQAEIEANERRARDEEDVGVEEDVLRENEDGDTVPGIFSRFLEGVGDDEDDRTKEEEYSDNTKVNDSGV